MTISAIKTPRLIIRPLTLADVDFIIEQFNEPDVLHFIGNLNISTTVNATEYIIDGPQLSYQQNGYGSMAICLKGHESVAIGLAGLLKRVESNYPELGYTLLSKYYGYGYGKEAAKAVLAHYLEYKTILAQVSSDNVVSKKLLVSLGFQFSYSDETTRTETYQLNR